MVSTDERRGSRERGPRARSGVTAIALGLSLLAIAAAAAPACAVTCSARVDRSRVAPGEQIVLTVTIEGAFQSAPTPEMPALDGIEAYGGGTSQSFAFVNGQVSARVESTFYLVVRRDQSFVIPALPVPIEGKTYSTQPIPIEVVPGSGRGGASGPGRPAAPPGGQGSGAPAATGPVRGVSTGGGRPGDEFFITMAADKTRAYVGEQIVLVFRFHRRVQMWDSPQYQAPRTEGFWREDLPPERNSVQTIAGRRYEVTEIRYALFPTRAGALTIEPAEVLVPGDLLDRFFGGPRDRGGPQRLRSDPVTIDVLDLPSPRPPGFNGVVARRVSLSARTDRAGAPRGEPVSLKVELSADGFLKGLAGIPLPPLAGVRVHDAGESFKVDKSGDRLASRYTVEKVLVPTTEGRLDIPSIALVYFDPAQGKFATARTQPLAVMVTPSDLPREGEGEASPERAEIARLGQDLAFIHSAPGRLRTRTQPLTDLPLWWAGALAPLALLAGWRWRLERQRRDRLDPAAGRQRRALADARRLLRQARGAGERPQALALLARAALGFVADRTDRAAAALGAEDVRRFAAEAGEEEAGQRLAEIIDLADAERFGAGRAGGAGRGARDIDALCAETENLLRVLERAGARNGPPRRGASSAIGGRGALIGVAALAVLGLAVSPARPAAPAAGAAAAGGPTAPAAAGSPAARAAARGALAEAGSVPPRQLLAEGNQAYTGNDVATALARYETALAAGINDPVLHYNLGNAYARQGRLGRAVLAYLRAQRLDPRDRDVRANLAWVRAHTRDLELQPQKLPPVVAQVVGAARLLALDEWSVVLLVVLWIFCALVAWIWRRGVTNDLSRRALIAGGAALCLVAAVTSVLYYEERVRDQAVVVVPEVEVRSGPAASFPVVFRIHDGLPLTIRGAQGGWARIGLGGEWVGWVPAEDLERVRGL